MTTESDPIEQLYRDQGERLWRAVFAYSGRREIADDAVSESFAQLLRGGDAVREPARWVWTVAFKLARADLARRAKDVGTVRETSYSMPEPDDAVLRAIARLSPRQRACVVLRYYAGYPAGEIAQTIGSTTAAVKVHLSQGRKRLRTFLDEEATHDA